MTREESMVFYFTATGNSLYAAKQLDDERHSIAQAIHDENNIYKADRIGIVSPVFGHEVPALVKEFLEKSTFETHYFYMILTYGNRHAGAAELAEKLLKELGITPSYINVVLMVDNYLLAFDMEEQRKIDKKVDEQLAAIKTDIDSHRKYISPVTDQDRANHLEYLARVENEPDKAWFNVAYSITKDCIGCGICEKVCPKGCYVVEKQKSRWNLENCIRCMACIHACPMKAIRMNMPEKNPNARYRNENISICEIIDANYQTNL